MAAANDSQGLKIAVASFVSLSVILAVTSYFMYSNYSTADAKATEEAKKSSEAQRQLVEMKESFKEWRENISRDFSKYDDVKSLKVASDKATAVWEAKLNTLAAEMTKAVGDAQARGAKDKEIEKAREIAESLVSSIAKDPQPTYLSRIDRMVDLVLAEGQLIVAIANDNVDLRQNLEGVNQSNEQKVQLAQTEAKKARDEQIAEHKVYEDERKSFLDKIDTYQKLSGELTAQLALAKEVSEKSIADLKKKLDQMVAVIRGQHDQLDKNDMSFSGKRNGVITSVDYNRKEVHTTLTSRQGARPPMHVTVFDKNAQGLPTEKPKGTIELISVTDRGSTGKIIFQSDNSKPLHINDQLYSVAIGNKQFALVGKMDMNRDGKDDRQDVKRLIEMNGGKVVYDLPPPGLGHENGEITASADWIITDEEAPIYTRERVDRDPTPEDKDFFARKSEMIKLARDMGLRPMPLKKLAEFLGYSHGMTLPGRVETLDRATSNMLQNRKGNAPAPADKPKNDAADKPKDDAAEADPK